MSDDRRDGDVPRPDRPETEESYGIPTAREGTLSWTFVEDRMAGDGAYWVTTVSPDGRPHPRPTWGVWLDGAFHCGGGERTRWVRNLSADPRIGVHRCSATEVVIIEGTADRIAEGTEEMGRIDGAYEEKYGIRHGAPMFEVRPALVLAWSDFPADATRWRFDR